MLKLSCAYFAFLASLKAPTIALGKRCSDQIEQDECCIGNKPPVKPRANGRNIVGCYMLRPFSHSVGYEQGCTLCVSLVPHFIFLRDSRANETRARENHPTRRVSPFLV